MDQPHQLQECYVNESTLFWEVDLLVSITTQHPLSLFQIVEEDVSDFWDEAS